VQLFHKNKLHKLEARALAKTWESYLKLITSRQTAFSDVYQPTTNNQQPTTNNQQPTTNNQQPTTNNQQPTITNNNQQPTTKNQQQQQKRKHQKISHL